MLACLGFESQRYAGSFGFGGDGCGGRVGGLIVRRVWSMSLGHALVGQMLRAANLLSGIGWKWNKDIKNFINNNLLYNILFLNL